MNKPIYDLHRLTEDERLKLIGETAAAGNLTGVLVEQDQPEKIARYIATITKNFPTVRLVQRCKGPTKGLTLLQFGPKADN